MNYSPVTDGVQSTVFSRRAFILLGIKFVLFFIILVRLFKLQILQGSEYKTLADKNRIKLIPLQPRRGTIFDSKSRPLAEDITAYKVYFYKQKGLPYQNTLATTLKILKLPLSKEQTLIKAVAKAPYLQPITLKDSTAWPELAKLESELYRLPGTYVDKSYVRTYPLKNALAHITGYLGLPNSTEVALYKLQHARDTKIGQTGVEAILNPSLIGKLGSRKVEINANRVIVRTLTTESGTPGEDAHITIDATLQQFVHSKLADKSGGATVMDIATGNLLAVCSTPAFDPNAFATNLDGSMWKALITNKDGPLINKVIGKAYPPGSVWKIITALAILEAGIDPNEKVFCSGYVQIGNRKFSCAKQTGHGHVNFHDALPFSCNCYLYKMGIRVGIENIAAIAKILGAGGKSGFELPGEVQGINPNMAWKSQTHNSAWTQGDTANASIGQGFVLMTPMQMMVMLARVASNKAVQPRLLRTAEQFAEPHTFEQLPFKPEHLSLVRTGLSNVFNSPKGTGFVARITEQQFMMAGKTGTAQVMSRNVMEISSVKKELRSHSIFAGYAPVHAPKYVCTVVAENAGWGSGTAAPIGRDVLLFAQKNLA